jgi:hypothetical protein
MKSVEGTALFMNGLIRVSSLIVAAPSLADSDRIILAIGE